MTRLYRFWKAIPFGVPGAALLLLLLAINGLGTQNASAQCPPPGLNIQVNIIDPCPLAPVQLIATGVPANSSLAWDFGVGAGFVSATDTVQYNYGPGTFNPILRIVDQNGDTCDVPAPQVFIANPTPTYSITKAGDSCSGSQVWTFNATTPGSNYVWQIGNNTPAVLGQTATVTFTKAQSVPAGIEIFLQVIGSNGCPGYLTDTVYPRITSPIQFNFTGGGQSCTPPFTTNFTPIINNLNGNLIDSAVWIVQTPVGITRTSQIGSPTSISRTFIDVGRSTVTLVLYRNGGGCVDSVRRPNVVTIGLQTTPVLALTQTTICKGDTFTVLNRTPNHGFFIANGAGLYKLTISGGVLNNVTMTPTFRLSTIPAPGTYTVTLTYQSAGCISSVTQNITVTGPVAAIGTLTATPLNSCVWPYTINFRDTSTFVTNQLSYQWVVSENNDPDFSNPPQFSSTLENPSFTIPDSGLYTVCLYIEDLTTGCTDTVCEELVIKLPEATVAPGPYDLCSDETLTVDNTINTSENFAGYNFTWTLSPDAAACAGASVGSFTGAYPSISGLQPGIYSLQLIVDNDGQCADTVSVANWLRVSGVGATITPPASSGCLNASNQYQVAFTTTVNCNKHYTNPSNAVTHAWTTDPVPGLPNPTFSSTNSANPTVTFTANGSYVVRDLITNAEGCTTQVFSVVQVGTFADFSFNTTTVCVGQQINAISNTSSQYGAGVQWSWSAPSAGTAVTITNSTAMTPLLTFNQLGTFAIRLSILNNGSGCTDTITKFITAEGVAANFTASDTLFNCAPRVVTLTPIATANVVNYEWLIIRRDTLPNGTVVIDTTLEYSVASGVPTPLVQFFTRNGYYDVVLIVTHQAGCRDTLTRLQYVKIIGPDPNFTISDTAGCSPLTINFQDFSSDIQPGQFTMDYGDNSADGINYQLLQANSHTYEFPAGNFLQDEIDYFPTLSATDGVSCFITFQKKVTVYAKPYLRFGSLNGYSGCVPFSVNFYDSSYHKVGGSFEWDFGDGTTSVQANPNHVYTLPGFYTVRHKVTNSNGCSTDSIVTAMIEVKALPTANFTAVDRVVCINQPVQFNQQATPVTVMTGYSWNFGVAGTNLDTSIVANPVYSYSSPGTYNVSLTVTDGNGCSNDTTFNAFIVVSDTIPPPATTLQFVTVDPTSSFVSAAWNVSTSPIFGGYELYRGAPYDLPANFVETDIAINQWNDFGSSPNTGPVDYSIRVVSNCGFRTAPADSHVTVYATAAPLPFAAQVTWTPYIGWPVSHYDIYRSSDTTGFQFLDSVPGTTTTYQDSGLCGQQYIYYVMAYQQAGIYTSRSNNANVIPSYSFSTVPISITSTTVVNNSSTTTTWEPSTQPYITAYIIDRDENGSGVWQEAYASVPPTQLSFNDANVDVNASTYAYRVRFTNTCEDTSILSNLGTSILVVADLTPNINKLERQIRLRWTPYTQWLGGVLNYNVEYQSPSGWEVIATLPSSLDSFFDVNVPRETTTGQYCYRIRAYENAVGIDQDSSVSNESCVILPSRLFYPTAFTPEFSIGRNDSFFVMATGMLDYELEVYNRYGQVIWESKDPMDRWDGTYKGKPVEPGVYTLRILARGADNERFKIVDRLTIIR